MRPSPTTGGDASRTRELLPSPAVTVQAAPRLSPSATCALDLDALPPGCGQSLLATAGGMAMLTSARPGSTAIVASVVRTGTRLPTVGVDGFLPPPMSPHPLRTPSATKATINRFIDLLPSLEPPGLRFPQVPRRHPATGLFRSRAAGRCAEPSRPWSGHRTGVR